MGVWLATYWATDDCSLGRAGLWLTLGAGGGELIERGATLTITFVVLAAAVTWRRGPTWWTTWKDRKIEKELTLYFMQSYFFTFFWGVNHHEEKNETMAQREAQISPTGEERRRNKHWRRKEKKSQLILNDYHLEQSDMTQGTTGLHPVQPWKWTEWLWQACIVQRTQLIDPCCHTKQVKIRCRHTMKVQIHMLQMCLQQKHWRKWEWDLKRSHCSTNIRCFSFLLIFSVFISYIILLYIKVTKSHSV